MKAAKSALVTAKKQVCSEFKLTRFKSFREDFDFRDVPQFLARSVMVRENLTVQEGRSDLKFPALAYGHVWLRFRLADTLDDDDALKAMVGTARRMLKQKRRELLDAAGGQVEQLTGSPGAGPKSNYERHLRFLDLKHAGLTDGEALKRVHAKSKSEPTRKTRNKKSELEQAMKMPGKYLDVLYGRQRKSKSSK